MGSEGQDGRLLARRLKALGHRLMGISRSGPVDIRDARKVGSLLRRFKPHEVYYLAAYHHSSEDEKPGELELFEKSFEAHVLGLFNFLEGIRLHAPKARLFYAASSHVFGPSGKSKVDESVPLAPNSVYGITKAAGLLACRYYRARHGVFASAGILFNHESPLRGPRFVSRRIVQGAVAAKKGRLRPLVLGDLSARADWGWAPDYVEAMRRIITHKAAGDFVIATGKTRSVRDFARAAFAELGLDWRRHVREDRRLLRRAREAPLSGDPRRLMRATGWRPTLDFRGMVTALVRAEFGEPRWVR